MKSKFFNLEWFQSFNFKEKIHWCSQLFRVSKWIIKIVWKKIFSTKYIYIIECFIHEIGYETFSLESSYKWEIEFSGHISFVINVRKNQIWSVLFVRKDTSLTRALNSFLKKWDTVTSVKKLKLKIIAYNKSWIL